MFCPLLFKILLPFAVSLVAASQAQSSADVAKDAAADRDRYIDQARVGIKHITSFVANTSACISHEAACEQARQEQRKSLQRLTAAAKAATQHSKKAGQVACKFARKAGVAEHEAEGARDAAEREAERLEDEAEQQADKAQDRMDSAFEIARRHMMGMAAKKDMQTADIKTAPEALSLAVAPLSVAVESTSQKDSAKPIPADVAKTAASDRDRYIEEARAGIKHITDFVANTSACISHEAACEQARQEQRKSLQRLTAAAKVATQHSKKAGQVACKFARKAGVAEHEAEGARDAAEREAERLEDEAEQQADKAQDRMDSAFEIARRQMKAVSKKTQAASKATPAGVPKASTQKFLPTDQVDHKTKANNVEKSAASVTNLSEVKPNPVESLGAGLNADRLIYSGVALGLLLIFSASILGITVVIRRAARVDTTLEQPILSAEGSPNGLFQGLDMKA